PDADGLAVLLDVRDHQDLWQLRQVELERLHDVERAQAPGEGDVLGGRHVEVTEQQDAVPGPRGLDRGDRLRVEGSREVHTDDLRAEARVEWPKLDLHDVAAPA